MSRPVGVRAPEFNRPPETREIPPRPHADPHKLKLHFNRSLNAKLSNAAFAGVQGLATWLTDSDQILAKDASGILLALDGRCAFIPWANLAWIEVL